MSISKLTHILGNESKESIAILEKGGFALRNPLCFGWRSCRWWQGKMKAINFLEVNACFFFECFRFCSLSEAILNRIELCGPYCIAFWLYVGRERICQIIWLLSLYPILSIKNNKCESTYSHRNGRIRTEKVQLVSRLVSVRWVRRLGVYGQSQWDSGRTEFIL